MYLPTFTTHAPNDGHPHYAHQHRIACVWLLGGSGNLAQREHCSTPIVHDHDDNAQQWGESLATLGQPDTQSASPAGSGASQLAATTATIGHVPRLVGCKAPPSN